MAEDSPPVRALASLQRMADRRVSDQSDFGKTCGEISGISNDPIQREVNDDLAAAFSNVADAENYSGNVGAQLNPYANTIVKMEETGDGHLMDCAERMAGGFAAWAENFSNKSAAYLFEAEIAATSTEVRRNPNIYAILGVDTDEEPDLDLITNETIMTNDPYPVVDHQEMTTTAVEAKASTSEKYDSVDTLVANGMKQLKKREDTQRYDRLLLKVDNAHSSWPVTDLDLNTNFHGDIDQVPDDHAETRLSARIAAMKATYGITLPVEVEASALGRAYASVEV